MKDRQHLIVFFVILGLILLVGIFCYTKLEIVPSTRWENPSREVRANRYYALDKWLGKLGCPVRILSRGNIDTLLKGPEQTVFIENSCFKWMGDSDEDSLPGKLISWLQEGNRLIVSINEYESKYNFRLTEFMNSLGVKIADDDDDETGNVVEYKNGTAAETIEKEPEVSPFFDYFSAFKIIEKKTPVDRILVMKRLGEIKLVKLTMNKGWIVFTGEANFLQNYYLQQNENAKLAGDLFFAGLPEAEIKAKPNAETAEDIGAGVLFIRSLSGDRHFFGNLAERGNPAALTASIFLLIVIGFWMVIPPFGRYRPAPEKPGKPLRERFLAEGRFLKKYHVLGKYLEVYEKELEHQIRCRGSESTHEVRIFADHTETITFKQFITKQKALTKQMEELNKSYRGSYELYH
ncbi:MAG: hypothetical protein FWG27_00790 [Treponema sp.]|nr:hypothetical protein [Treponema sp.]